MLISKAEKKEGGGGKGGKGKKAIPPQLIPESGDVINIYKGKEDPPSMPFYKYPRFVFEMLEEDLEAKLLPNLITQGQDLSIKSQLRLMKYMRRYKNQQRLLMISDEYMQEDDVELGMEDTPYGADRAVRDPFGMYTVSKTLRKPGLKQIEIEQDPDAIDEDEEEGGGGGYNKKEEEDEKEKRRQAILARQEEIRQKKLEEMEIKKKGVKIGGKRVHMFTNKERKEMRKLKRQQERMAKEGKEEKIEEDKEEDDEGGKQSGKRR